MMKRSSTGTGKLLIGILFHLFVNNLRDLFFQPDGGGAGVGVEGFDAAKGFNHLRSFFEVFFGEVDEADATAEVFDG